MIPKEIPAEDWRQLSALRNYALRSTPEEVIYLRLGQGQGIFLLIGIAPQITGRVVCLVDLESGEPALLGRIPEGEALCLGRTSECAIKVMHAIVSRQHLRLAFEGAILVVRDLGSTNGTYFHKDCLSFDIQEYSQNPPEDPATAVPEWLRDVCGPNLSDFLKRHSDPKETEK